MKEYEVTLTQSARENIRAPFLAKSTRSTPAIVRALDANDAARRAQKTYPGWTAVLVLEAA